MPDQPMPAIPTDQTEQTALILATLTEVVAEFGADHVYGSLPAETWIGGHQNEGCRYVSDDDARPVCIVAQVLYRLGVSMTELHRYEGRGVHAFGRGVTPHLDLRGLTDYSVMLLREAQVVQDRGGRWGDALKRAEFTVEYWPANGNQPEVTGSLLE